MSPHFDVTSLDAQKKALIPKSAGLGGRIRLGPIQDKVTCCSWRRRMSSPTLKSARAELSPSKLT